MGWIIAGGCRLQGVLVYEFGKRRGLISENINYVFQVNTVCRTSSDIT